MAAQPLNILLLTYDSCRYDVARDAKTPVLDAFAPFVAAYTPATFTYAAHMAFFVGMLPHVTDDTRYYNRFNRQLLGLTGVGGGQMAGGALVKVASEMNLVAGLSAQGYQTVGAGAMDWFRQKPLTLGFDKFLLTGVNAEAQIDFLLRELDPARPFFGFINFGETHAPYWFQGKEDVCPVDVRARMMAWPPIERGPVGRDNQAYGHQVRAVEYLDRCLPRLFAPLPGHTIVVVCGDHGDCFGEDGYWGHGINHPKVHEVPLALFRLDRQPLV